MCLKKNLLFILFCVLYHWCLSQNNSEKTAESHHSIRIGLGVIEYNNSNTIPYGMRGSTLNFCYRLNRHNLIKERDFFYDISFDYSGLKNPYIVENELVLFNYIRFNTRFGWMRPIENGIENLVVTLGLGANFEGEYISSNEEADFLIAHSENFGKWLVSSPCLIRINYPIKRIRLINTFQLPLLGLGHFPQYQYGEPSRLDDNYYSYFMKPNTITHLGNYKLIENEFGVRYQIGKITVNMSYVFTACYYVINYNRQRYLQHSFGVGVTF